MTDKFIYRSRSAAWRKARQLPDFTVEQIGDEYVVRLMWPHELRAAKLQREMEQAMKAVYGAAIRRQLETASVFYGYCVEKSCK